MTAFVNDMAASAAYGIASAANEIVVSPTSIVGSIGVVMTHMDRSKQLERSGVKPTLVYAGAHKVDANPFGPLSETVQADLQTEVMKFYDQFVGLVARGRPGMGEQAIRDTEARTYIGEDAIKMGLADRVASLDDVLAGPARPRRVPAPRRAASAAPAPNAATDPAERLKAILALPEARGRRRQAIALAIDANATPAGAAELLRHMPLDADGGGIDVNRNGSLDPKLERMRSIMLSPEASSREGAALAFAYSTDLPADQVQTLLARLEKEPDKPRTPSIAERAAAEAEFGGTFDPVKRGSSELWSDAVRKANAAVPVPEPARPVKVSTSVPTINPSQGTQK